jgi:hypothetical protein
MIVKGREEEPRQVQCGRKKRVSKGIKRDSEGAAEPFVKVGMGCKGKGEGEGSEGRDWRTHDRGE